jgi:hypothetical protein
VRVGLKVLLKAQGRTLVALPTCALSTARAAGVIPGFGPRLRWFRDAAP